MAYEIAPARELLSGYPEHTQELYGDAGIGVDGWEDLDAETKLSRICSTAGNTVMQSYEFDGLRGAIHAKLELNSPTGSHCDRQAFALRKMVEDGLIIPGVTTIDETSSGSVVSSLAIQAPLSGIQVHARVPRNLDQNRLATMRQEGVDLELVDGYIPEAAKAMLGRMKQLEADSWTIQKHYTTNYRAFSATHRDGQQAGHIVFANHSANPVTIEAVRPLGLEMVQQLAAKDIRLDAMLVIIGNGTSVYAISQAIRQYQPQAAIIGIEDARNHPTYDRVHNTLPMLRHYSGHDSYGSSFHGTPVAYKVDKIVDAVDIVAPQPRDAVRDVFNRDHPETAIGNTSAMALKVGSTILGSLNKKSGAHVGVVFYDGAMRYDYSK